jgi:hypothetical protein
MNEEFFWILAEIVPCLVSVAVFGPQLQLFPYFLNLDTLWISWSNKGGHTRTAPSKAGGMGDYDPDNFHADHHTLHRNNFGSAWGVFIDFYFGTQGRHTKGVGPNVYLIGNALGDAEGEGGGAVGGGGEGGTGGRGDGEGGGGGGGTATVASDTMCDTMWLRVVDRRNEAAAAAADKNFRV